VIRTQSFYVKLCEALVKRAQNFKKHVPRAKFKVDQLNALPEVLL